ncbi:MAG TPA: DeoR/GlpR transcriptional regulator [Candidatus Merdisoma faecalis]|uniref:DeoR/GlpR family DNA-binding transcription regulator n=1 Tax=Lachnoclostridium sp. An138 TaxID=1965560 RepID=UPI000B37ECF3|nr:DeoR/GlpR family DNA-binding transcription regulator [Lachnoclostridium sp. An138]OUQ19916.1 ArsR family transcriptional regulator [Lachnoclostridium sp. An138]HIR98294.1 DeoR/GlpR transcriptional regulator [Candidatus Merdisoma faecalis]
MKASRSIVNSRRERILETVRSEGDVTVSTLAEQLQVSPLTIRRDLQYLEEHKLLERFYGGARTGGAEEARKNSRELRKERIARYAASLVEDRDSIFINTSSTALAMVKYIKSRRVTIITNNGNIINEENPSQATIILLGGELRYMKGAMVGDFAKNNLSQVTAKKSFIGCSGLSPDIGMTTEMVSEVNLNQMMFQRVTGTSYILADGTKFGEKIGRVSCPPEKIENIITDMSAPPEMVRQFREIGTWVYQVD